MEKSLVVLCILLFFTYSYVSAQNCPPKTLVSTVSKNTILPIFTFTLNTNQEFFIHIGGPYLVRKCNDGLPRPIVPCGSPVCALTRGVSPHQCPLPNNTIINGVCACQATAFEPFQRLCNSDQFTYGDLSISSLNPISPSVTFNNVSYLCIPKPFLVDTRLIRNPRKLNNYFLGLKGISVNGKRILLASNAFDFDCNGDGGVTLGTVFPFTTLRSDVYKVFIEAFAQATSDIQRVSNTTSLEFCLKSTTIFQVPRIDLELADGVIWKVSPANAMKKVSNDVACLAFVNGGDAAAQAVVIGIHQMENTLVEFDVGRSAFGFSCSLGLVNASCGDFQTRP